MIAEHQKDLRGTRVTVKRQQKVKAIEAIPIVNFEISFGLAGARIAR